MIPVEKKARITQVFLRGASITDTADLMGESRKVVEIIIREAFIQTLELKVGKDRPSVQPITEESHV